MLEVLEPQLHVVDKLGQQRRGTRGAPVVAQTLVGKGIDQAERIEHADRAVDAEMIGV